MTKNQNIPSEKTRFHSGRKKHRSIEGPYVQDLKRIRMIELLEKEICIERKIHETTEG
ncbi:MAG: hypothetical protein ACP5E8_06630 [Thermoplasmata archaeon]